MAKQKTAPLPGMERPSFPELDKKVEEYDEAKHSRITMLAKEIELKGECAGLMRKHGLATYRTSEDLIVSFESKLKVKKANDEEGDPELQ